MSAAEPLLTLERSSAPASCNSCSRPISEVSGRPVRYTDVSTEEHVAALTAAGLDEGTAQFVAALDANTAEGTLADTSTGDLTWLIGRPTTPLVEGLRAAVAAA